MPTPNDAATLQALFEGVDAVRDEMQAKWGLDRLPLLVDDDLRAKFYRQQVKWADDLRAAWEAPFLSRDALEGLQKRAGAMRRAWMALDAQAEENGCRAIFPDVMETSLEDGSIAAVVRTDAEAGKVIADGRYVRVYTMSEVGQIISMLPQALQMAKAAFPGASYQKPSRYERDRSWVAEGDEIPF